MALFRRRKKALVADTPEPRSTPKSPEGRLYDEYVADGKRLEAEGFISPRRAADQLIDGEITFEELLALAKAKKLRMPTYVPSTRSEHPTFDEIDEKVEMTFDGLPTLFFGGYITREQWDELSAAQYGYVDD